MPKKARLGGVAPAGLRIESIEVDADSVQLVARPRSASATCPDCVEVCPVDCFYEGKNMLVINPDEYIDCGVCILECPAEAIVTDADIDFEEKWLDLNATYSAIWPNISRRKDLLDEADTNNGIKDKCEFFDSAHGKDDG